MEKDIIGIYKITNKLNNHAYIGQSIHIHERWKQHIKGIDNSDLDYSIYNAFRKHGIENFDFSILEECEKEQLNEREKYWIAFYDTYYNGYNETKGGQGILGEMVSIPIEQYDLYGNFIAEYPSITAGAKATGASNISGVCKGKKYSSGGFQWFYKGKANPIDLTKCKFRNEKAVKQYSLNGDFIAQYDSVSAAAKAVGITPSRIFKNCNYICNHAGFYQWRFLEDNTTVEKITVQKFHYRPVAQYDKEGNFITKYNSISEAENQLGLKKKQSNIIRVCQGQAYESVGYQWRYIDPDDNIDYTFNIGKSYLLLKQEKNERKQKEKESIKNLKEKEPRILPTKKVAQCDKQSHKIIQIFNSVKEASQQTGVCDTSIYRVCKGTRKSAGGYYWIEYK